MYNAGVAGTIGFLARRIPVIGTIILVGGVGWSSYKLYRQI